MSDRQWPRSTRMPNIQPGTDAGWHAAEIVDDQLNTIARQLELKFREVGLASRAQIERFDSQKRYHRSNSPRVGAFITLYGYPEDDDTFLATCKSTAGEAPDGYSYNWVRGNHQVTVEVTQKVEEF